METKDKLSVFICGENGCKHDWNGPFIYSSDGCVGTATCSKCGVTAIDFDMMNGD